MWMWLFSYLLCVHSATHCGCVGLLHCVVIFLHKNYISYSWKQFVVCVVVWLYCLVNFLTHVFIKALHFIIRVLNIVLVGLPFATFWLWVFFLLQVFHAIFFIKLWITFFSKRKIHEGIQFIMSKNSMKNSVPL